MESSLNPLLTSLLIHVRGTELKNGQLHSHVHGVSSLSFKGVKHGQLSCPSIFGVKSEEPFVR